MKKYEVIGIGNALVDILIDVTDAEFAPLGLQRGTQRLVGVPEQTALLSKFINKSPALVSGGSVANSMIGFAQLGGKGAFIASIGDDKYGLFYAGEFASLGIDLVNPPVVGGVTGNCSVLVTPDSERTMGTCLAISSELCERNVSPEAIASSEWLFVEGYVFANPENGQGAIRKAIRAAKDAGVKIAITCSEAWVIGAFSDAIRDAIAQADLVFTNETEAMALTAAKDGEEAFILLSEKIPNVLVTLGAKGARGKWQGQAFSADAFPCKPRDLTGAGDMFAGSFLYGVTHGVDPVASTRAACYLAMQVISRVGARLHTGTKDYWDAVLRGQV